MGVNTNFTTGENPVDVLTAFKETAKAHYTAVYVKLGKGRHSYGESEFYTMNELAADIEKATQVYKIDTGKLDADITATTAIIKSNNKRVYGAFMDAMLGKNVQRNAMTAQVSNQSLEWHQAAKEHLARVKTARHAANLPDSLYHIKNVAGFRHMLVDYVFKDVDALQSFCQEVRSGSIDKRAKELRSAGQQHHNNNPA